MRLMARSSLTKKVSVRPAFSPLLCSPTFASRNEGNPYLFGLLGLGGFSHSGCARSPSSALPDTGSLFAGCSGAGTL